MLRHDSGSPADWLRYARSDLILAESAPPSGVLLEALCFHAQQAAQKALKGVLIHAGVDPAHTHDIHRLLDEVAALVELPRDVREAASLTEYAVLSRYPADFEEIDSTEWKETVALARVVVDWAASVIESKGTH